MSFESLNKTENQEKIKPSEVVTANGSVYRYLIDGRTQRFKTVEGKLYKPQDILVFIPPWDTVSEKAKELYPEIFKNVTDEDDYVQLLLKYAQIKGFTIRVTDDNGKELKTNVEVELSLKAFAAFVDKKNQNLSFYLPISKDPKVDYYTYDTTKYVGDDGETYRERHMGNKVVNIKYRS